MIYSSYSGQFLTPLWTGNDPTGTVFSGNRTPAQVTIRPNALRDANLTGDQQTVDRWFDATAFGAPTPGQFGTSAKGVIKGPPSAIVNSGLFKRIDITERVRVRLEITSAAGVGVITAVGGPSALDSSGARSFRTAVRLEF